jgi:CubicO group peptidase (beta-lactamase class C family)
MTCEWPEALRDACLRSGVPGAVFALRLNGQEDVWTFGSADVETGRPVTPDTIFRAGSMTKTMTALMVMQQVEEGRIDLDAPVRGILPELVLADLKAAEILTTRHLLSHRAGFFGDVLDGPSVDEDALQKYAQAAGRLEQITPPGELFSYNNAAFALAGRLTEWVAGTSWPDLFVHRLAEPLGMTRTGMRWGEHFPDGDLAVCHLTGETGALSPIRDERENPALAPAGSMPWTSARDVMTLGRLLSGRLDSPVVSAASLEAMRSWAPGPTSTFATGWGLGLQIHDLKGRLVGHDGAVAGGQSFLRTSLDEDLVAVLMVNGGDGRSVFHDLFSLLEASQGRALATPTPDWPEVGIPFDPAPLIGRYAVARYAVQVTARSDASLYAHFAPTAEAGDFSQPMEVEMQRQPDDPTDELFLTRFPPNWLPTQQRFLQSRDGRSFLLFRGRLFPKVSADEGPGA